VLVAVGFTIVFGLSRIVNIAYGDFLTLGAYIVFIVAPGGAIAFVWGFGAAAVGVGVLTLLLERLLFRWTLPRPVNGFLISLGLVQIIENGLAYKYTANPVTVQPAINRLWVLGGVDIPADQVIVIGGTLLIVILLVMYLDHTRQGLAIRAVSTDREAAALMGAPVTRLVAGVFALGGVLAGAGGAFVALLEPASPTLGAELVLKGFVVALVGGLGNVKGAFVGAVLLAVTETILVTVGLTAWLDPLEFGAVILLLLFKPMGLLGGVAHSM
jgi:branched-chain amino acid transport system permease protein